MSKIESMRREKLEQVLGSFLQTVSDAPDQTYEVIVRASDDKTGGWNANKKKLEQYAHSHKFPITSSSNSIAYMSLKLTGGEIVDLSLQDYVESIFPNVNVKPAKKD